jgi:hypothetical protein
LYSAVIKSSEEKKRENLQNKNRAGLQKAHFTAFPAVSVANRLPITLR